MKIGMVCYPSYGGSGAVATELGKKLAERGHKVHFISSDVPFRLIGPWRKNIFFHQVEVLDYPVFQSPPYTIALANKIIEIASNEKLNIIHTHYAIPHAVSAYMAKIVLKNPKIKLVTTLHGTDITISGHNPTMHALLAYTVKHSDVITAVSKSLAEEAKDLFDLGSKKVKIIYNFVDLPTINKKQKALREIFAGSSEKIIIHVSNFREVKRIKDVIKIFHGINKKIDSKLLLVGDGPDQSLAYKQASKYKIVNKIHFLGLQSNIDKLLNISDLFLLPSEKESFGLAALEAMGYKVPVIASNTGGLPELIENGKTGFLADVGNTSKMVNLALDVLKDSDLSKKIKDNAIKTIEKKFKSSVIVPQYLNLYKKLIVH